MASCNDLISAIVDLQTNIKSQKAKTDATSPEGKLLDEYNTKLNNIIELTANNCGTSPIPTTPPVNFNPNPVRPSTPVASVSQSMRTTSKGGVSKGR